MTKVAPPSSQPRVPARTPSRPASAGTDKPRRPRSSDSAQKDKAKVAKTSPKAAESEAASEAAEVGGGDGIESSNIFSSAELNAELEKHAEAWVPDTHTDREEKVAKDEETAKEERAEKQDAPKRPGEKQPQKQAQHSLAKQWSGAQGAKRGPSDGFEAKSDPLRQAANQAVNQPMRAAAAMVAKAVAAAVPPPPTSAPRPGRPPDAMTLLHGAKEAGVYFKEDAHREGHSEEKDDPELAAAVEECIRLLFGVSGVHRVGPGKNSEGEPVVVVVANRGFGEASMKRVPEKVYRFPTLLALPYDLLPLRRER